MRLASQPKLFVGSGGPFQLTAARSVSTAQLSARSRLPAYIQDWIFEVRASVRGARNVGLTANDWAAFPGIGISRLAPCMLLRQNAELLARFSNFIAQSAQIQRFPTSPSSPPPPPASAEDTWHESGNLAWLRRPGAPAQADGRQHGFAWASGGSQETKACARANVDQAYEVCDF